MILQQLTAYVVLEEDERNSAAAAASIHLSKLMVVEARGGGAGEFGLVVPTVQHYFKFPLYSMEGVTFFARFSAFFLCYHT